MINRNNFNAETNSFRIEGIAEKIGSHFSEEGRIIGKTIDDFTNNNKNNNK